MRPNNRGQFIPITAMVMFTTVVFLVAVVNIYKVTRAKLRVQNLADAAALNVASQMASSINKVADLNEAMNHFVGPPPGQTPSLPGDVPNCQTANPSLPPLSCADNPNKNPALNMFLAQGDAVAYARLVQMINQSQKLFYDTYNNFIGAGNASNSSISSKSSLNSILYSDIPDLKDVHVFVTNDEIQKINPKTLPTTNTPLAPGAPAGSLINRMQPLRFKIHPVTITYKTDQNIVGKLGMPLGIKPTPVSASLGKLLVGKNQPIPDVGWMEPDVNNPLIKIGTGSAGKPHYGAWVMVWQDIQVPVIGSVKVMAKAQAYVVEGSGMIGTSSDVKPDPVTGVARPVFKPTYWVKLAGVQ